MSFQEIITETQAENTNDLKVACACSAEDNAWSITLTPTARSFEASSAGLTTTHLHAAAVMTRVNIRQWHINDIVVTGSEMAIWRTTASDALLK